HVMDSRTEYHTVAELDVINSTTSVHSLNHPATSEIYTLSLHDALPISVACRGDRVPRSLPQTCPSAAHADTIAMPADHPRQSSRSEEHTSELQSLAYLVCRLLLEKKKQLMLPLAGLCGAIALPWLLTLL